MSRWLDGVGDEMTANEKDLSNKVENSSCFL